MIKRLLAAACLAGALSLAGCGKPGEVEGKDISAKSSAEDIGAAYITEMTRIADALDTVKDEASAKAAAAKIRAASEGLEKMSDELEGDMDPAKAMRIFGGRYQELIQAQSRIATAMMRINTEHPELWDIVSAEMDSLEQ